MVLGFLHGDLVPGYLYRQERDQRIKAEMEASENTKAIKTIAETVQSATDDRRAQSAGATRA